MSDQKVMSAGNATVWLVPVAGIANYLSPTAAEINAGLDITDALAWDGTTIPAGKDSDDVDDRSLRDRGNATTRGAAQFEGTLNLYYPKDLNENTTDYGKAFTFLRVPRVPVYAVTRVLQGTTGVKTAAAAGEWVSVFRFLTDGWENVVAGDSAFKYTVSLLAQGDVAVYTQVKNATAPSILPATLAVTVVGAAKTLRATLGGKRATQVVTWASSDVTKATVTQNGVVKGIAAGTANITCSHPSGSATSTACVVTVS